MGKVLYTIGHSNQSLDAFVAALQAWGVTAVADVRSFPYSRTNPQFDREALRRGLKSSHIRYVFLGRELGARTEDASCYTNGRVDYERLAGTKLFQQGLDRIQHGIENHQIAIMCSEKEPLACHRTILIARHLVQRDFSIKHILRDAEIEYHDATMGRLLRILNLDTNVSDMFRSKPDLLEEAYRIQGRKIAYERAKTKPPIEKQTVIHVER
ncbi:MAG: DUF488 family protein [Candidatus Acidiferrales bacterium]